MFELRGVGKTENLVSLSLACLYMLVCAIAMGMILILWEQIWQMNSFVVKLAWSQWINEDWGEGQV